ncbi:MAG TPA: TIGR04551 family protein [Polyangiaceae bacterium]|nr:TIGR04551 family protein [Polyangiaceae bacterium]
MKHASVASLVALGFLTIPALADAQPKPAGTPAEAAPATPPAPTERAQPSAQPSTEAPAADAASDDDAAPAPPAPAPGTPTGSFNPLPAWPEPGNDAAELKRQSSERPSDSASKRAEGQVFAEDWWAHARPVLELHGSFRARAEMFYQFALGRHDVPGDAMWPQPADNYFRTLEGTGFYGPQLCTPDEVGAGNNNSGTSANLACTNNTQMMGNMRFRLDPELHISDNLRVVSQIDLFDNLVLGSTPNEYANTPYGNGYAVAARTGYAPIGFHTTTTAPPTSGVNSLRDSIRVKRAWAEYATPVGELRFGRMPNHWGLGILNNAGDGYDDNYQSTIDRIQFTTGFKPLDLYVTGAWDFINEGATSDNLGIYRGQPYDVAQSDDVSQYMLSVTRRKSREMTRLSLARGEVVINAGVQVAYRHQLLANDTNNGLDASQGQCSESAGAASLSCSPGLLQFRRRGATSWTPDVWLQILYKKFRFEAEGVTIQGNMDNDSPINDKDPSKNIGYRLRQYGIATELEQLLVEDKLRLGFNFGWASGDSDVQGLAPPNVSTGDNGQHGDRTDSTFRFNPAYNIDLILYRNILTRVQGTYYFRPSASYDFLRDASGQKLGGGVAAIWSRASEFMQSPGHAHDLGIELNANVYFQSKDGARNDDPTKKGGFFTKLEYGVLFPMAGLGYTQNQAANLNGAGIPSGTNTAQTVRWYMGVFF